MSDAPSALPIDRPTRHRLNRKIERKALNDPAEVTEQRQEAFAALVASGLPISDALLKSGLGWHVKHDPLLVQSAANNLYKKPEIFRKVKDILDARSAQTEVTLGEITHMLRCVYRGAMADKDWGPAHNAAHSLGKLHGLMIDRTSIDIRRPSRDPDAPAELAIDSWISQLDGGPAEPRGSHITLSTSGNISSDITSPGQDITSPTLDITLSTSGNMASTSDITSSGSGITSDYLEPGSPGNGAPVGPVTGTPSTGALSEPEAEPEPHLCKNASVGPLFPMTGPSAGAKNEPETPLPAIKKKGFHRLRVNGPRDADGRRIRPPDKRFKENKSPEMRARSAHDPLGLHLQGKGRGAETKMRKLDPDYPF